MKKGKAITLLSIICVILVAVIVATFARFSVGIKDYNSFLGAINLDFDLEGGVSYTYSPEHTEDANVDEVIKLMSTRLEKLGYDYYSIEAVKVNDEGVVDSDIIITLKNTSSVGQDVEAVTAYGTVQMYAGTSSSDAEVVLEGKKAVEYCKYMGEATALEGEGYKMQIKFTSEACDIIKNGKEYVKLVLGDDANNVLFESTISYSQLSNGKYDFGYNPQAGEAFAKRVALQLSTGGLSNKYKQVKVEEVSAIFGENSKTLLIVVISILLVAVIVAFSILFKGFGLVSGVSLLTFILSEIILLVTIPGVILSTSGVAGIILAGVLVTDGLIITIKRMQEEFENGKTVKAAVNAGYRRSFRPILNTHVVALIISLIAFLIVGGTVKSFAITLSLGVALSFIITAFVSKLLTVILIPIVKNPEGFFNFKKKGDKLC